MVAGFSNASPIVCEQTPLSFGREEDMHGIIYLVGLVVVILAILSFFGLR